MNQKSHKSADKPQAQRSELSWSNNRNWQSLSDDWVKASHASRKRKEAARRKR